MSGVFLNKTVPTLKKGREGRGNEHDEKVRRDIRKGKEKGVRENRNNVRNSSLHGK